MSDPDPDPDLATTRARSVLVRATSGYARWLDPDAARRHGSLVAAIHLDRPGRPGCAHGSPVVLEISDPAPVPVRDRVRARVRLRGSATRTRGTAHGIQIQPTTVHFETAGGTVQLNPVDLWWAEPDPLALAEAGLLSHLDSCHPETMAMLTRLIPDEIRARVRRIAPLALDRGGIVLRVENAAGHLDVRLAFDRDVTQADHAPGALAALLGLGDPPAPAVSEAGRRSLLTALMGAGPAAARICAPKITTPPGTHGTAH